MTEQAKALLIESANLKEKVGRDAAEQGNRVMARLIETDKAGGITFVLSDPEYARKAAHFYEELACRYRAGAPYGRPDRKKMRSESLSEKPLALLPQIAKSYFQNREEKKDTLLVFAGAESSASLVEACRVAKECGVFLAVACGEKNTALISRSDAALSIPSSSPEIISAVHSVLIHALCEALEPEYETLEKNMLKSL